MLDRRGLLAAGLAAAAAPFTTLAVITELAFELLGRFMVPRHLLQKSAE